MHYRYKKHQTSGPNGTTIIHRDQDGTEILWIGELDGYTYLYTDTELDLSKQPEQINMEQVTLTDEQVTQLKQQRPLRLMKEFVRKDIRKQKSLEDDLVDNKQIIQWLAYAIADIYSVLSDDQKAALKYGDNIAMFAAMLADPNNLLRIDVEPNPTERVAKVFSDEVNFAGLAEERYLRRLK